MGLDKIDNPDIFPGPKQEKTESADIELVRRTCIEPITDPDDWLEEVIRRNVLIRTLLSKHTGQTAERIAQDTNSEFFMDAEPAKEYGIIDEILKSAKVPVEAGSGDSDK